MKMNVTFSFKDGVKYSKRTSNSVLELMRIETPLFNIVQAGYGRNTWAFKDPVTARFEAESLDGNDHTDLLHLTIYVALRSKHPTLLERLDKSAIKKMRGLLSIYEEDVLVLLERTFPKQKWSIPKELQETVRKPTLKALMKEIQSSSHQEIVIF